MRLSFSTPTSGTVDTFYAESIGGKRCDGHCNDNYSGNGSNNLNNHGNCPDNLKSRDSCRIFMIS